MLAGRAFTFHGPQNTDLWSKNSNLFNKSNHFSIAGGKVVERGVGIACCGDEEIGEAYNENDQICCFQRPDVNVYDRETPVSCLYMFVFVLSLE